MQTRSESRLLMIVSIAIAVFPVWRSPMISSRWPRPIGIIESIALRPVCIGSDTGCRWTTPGALCSAERVSVVLMSPLSSSGRPSGSTRRPSSSSPTGISSSLPVRFTVSSSDTLSHSPKSTAPTLSSSRLSASPTTSCGSSSLSSDMQLSTPWMRAIPSPISSTVPTSERSAESVSRPSIRSRRMLAISSGLISMFGLCSFLRRLGDALSQFLKPVAKARVQDHVPDLHHQPAEDVGVDPALELNGVAGLLLDLGSDPLDDLGIELDRAGHGDAEPLVLLRPEGIELAADPVDHRHPVLLDQQGEEVDQLGLAVLDGPLQPVALLGRREVGAEEEDLHLSVLRQRIDELAELIADLVELALVLRRREQRRGVHASNLLHQRFASINASPPQLRFRGLREYRFRGLRESTRCLLGDFAEAVSAQAREVHLGQGLLNQPLLVLGIERLAGHLLGRQHGQVGHLLSDPLERAPRLRLDVSPGGGKQLLTLLAPLLHGLVGCRLGRPAGAGDDVICLLAGLFQPGAVLGQDLVRLLPGALGLLDRLADQVGALVERLLDSREGDLAEHVHREPEDEQRPDHQPERWRDQEAAAGVALGGERQCGYERDWVHPRRPRGRRRSGRR